MPSDIVPNNRKPQSACPTIVSLLTAYPPNYLTACPIGNPADIMGMIPEGITEMESRISKFDMYWGCI